MDNKFSLKAAFLVSKKEYIRWITDARMILMPVMLVFVYSFAVSPLLDHAEKMNSRINIFEPFVAICNSSLLILLMPLLFMTLISDYPIMGNNTLFVIHRTGKGNWFLGQLIFFVLAIVSFMSCILLVTAICSGGTFGMEWSDVVTKYLSVYPDAQNSLASLLLPSNLYNQLSLSSALQNTVLMVGMYLFMLSMVLCLFRILRLQQLGVFFNVAIIAIGAAGTFIDAGWMWAFPVANAIVWKHFTEILSKPVYPINNSYIYFGAAIFVLLLLNIVALKKTSMWDDRG